MKLSYSDCRIGNSPERYAVLTDERDNPNTATVQVFDEDGNTPFANVTNQSSQVSEGENIVFSFNLFPVQNGTVAVNFRLVQDGDFIPFGVPKSVRVTSEGTSLTIATDNNIVEKPNGSLTEVVLFGDGYGVGRSEATIAIADDDPNSNNSERYSIAGLVITTILTTPATDSSPPIVNTGQHQSALTIVSIAAAGNFVKEFDSAVFLITTEHTADTGIAIRMSLS